MPPGEVKRVFAYLRVSSIQQKDSGAGLAAQWDSIRSEAKRRNWEVVSVYQDAGISAKRVAKQPQLQAALVALKSHAADGIVVAKLDRLTRSLGDFADLLARGVREGWSVVALDLNIDTSTPQGEAMANMLAVFAQWERRIIGVRTREALAVKRREGKRFGSKPYMAPEVATWVFKRYCRLDRARGVQARLVRELNMKAKKNPLYAPPHGGSAWRQSTIHDIVQRQLARASGQ